MKHAGRVFMIFLLGFALVFGLSHRTFAAKQIVICTWGGSAAKAMHKCFFDDFEKDTGVKVITTSPPHVGKIKAQVDSGNIEWDLVFTDLGAIEALISGDKVYLEKIDYSKIDPKLLDQIMPEIKREYSIGGHIYGHNICYNTNAFPKGKHPKSWAEVWDVKRFPGKRSFNDPVMHGGPPQLEAFLMADGVPIDKLYPIDVERAWRSADRIKPYVTKYWPSSAQAVQMLANGEVDVCQASGSRVIAAKWKGAPVDVEWNQGKMAADNWIILKESKNVELAYKLLHYSLNAKRQACYSETVPYGPTNKEAFEYIDSKILPDLITSPENVKKQYWHNVKWWIQKRPDGKTNREVAIKAYNEWILK